MGRTAAGIAILLLMGAGMGACDTLLGLNEEPCYDEPWSPCPMPLPAEEGCSTDSECEGIVPEPEGLSI